MVLALTIGEMFATGGITAALGLFMTFLMIGLLIGCLWLLCYILRKLENPSEKLQEQTVSDESEDAMLSVADTELFATTDPTKPIDEETMVAIQAAVKIYLAECSEDGKPHNNIKIKSVKRV